MLLLIVRVPLIAIVVGANVNPATTKPAKPNDAPPLLLSSPPIARTATLITRHAHAHDAKSRRCGLLAVPDTVLYL